MKVYFLAAVLLPAGHLPTTSDFYQNNIEAGKQSKQSPND